LKFSQNTFVFKWFIALNSITDYFLQQAGQHKELPAAVQNVLDSLAEKNAMRSGKVVSIIEEQHSRACTGHIKTMKDQNKIYVLFSPIDHRMPRIKVPAADCPKGMYQEFMTNKSC
jgi:hypothetical protein